MGKFLGLGAAYGCYEIVFVVVVRHRYETHSFDDCMNYSVHYLGIVHYYFSQAGSSNHDLV